MDTYKKSPKKPLNFSCEKCDFLCSSKKDFTRHLATQKHSILINTDGDTYEKTQKAPNLKIYVCVCGREYKHAQSLNTHKKKCHQIIDILDVNTDKSDKIDYEKLVNDLIATVKEQNKTIMEQNKTIQELAPKIGNNTNNIIVNNLTILNDSCKDALTMNEFIDSIEVEVKDLMYTSENGLATGITKLFLENYNKLPIQKRPLWCSDKKRKKLYIKQAEWEEDINLIKIKAAIKNLTSIQARSSGKYIKENPDWMEHDKKKERFVNIVKETTEDIDDNKQTHIINNLLDKVHLTDDVKVNLKNCST